MVLVVVIGSSCGLGLGRAQEAVNDAPGAQVLTRGPVHEAFAGIVTFNPEPGIVVTKAPPDIIAEVPPEERPEGDNVTWIPGYWAWDDERSDFLWVSGTWRALPPGRAWMAGYWGRTTQGYQWTSGYWADASAQETTYLPQPPATVEVGPNIAAPSVDYGWTPGCWIWTPGRYAWGPGYWAQGRADWDWTPAHYVWTPRGFIFVGGFWDYSVARRGVLFAPVYFEAGVYARRGYHYSPAIVINLSVFSEHLFLRPRYCHYYFGDYYAANYHQGGFYASFSFQSSRYGYDPFYSHQRWEHRRDREWEHRVAASYQYRREHETARPPRTWAAQRNINPTSPEATQHRLVMAAPLVQVARQKDGPVRFQPVAVSERQKLAQRGQEVQQSREQRRTLEATAVANPATRKPEAVSAPAKVALPRSPIVAKPVSELKKNQAPPKALQSPKPVRKVQPQAEKPGSQPKVDRSNPPSQPRKVEPAPKPSPARSEVAPGAIQVSPPSQPSAKDAVVKTPADSPRSAPGVERKAQPQIEQRVNGPAMKARDDGQQSAGAMEKKAQRVSEQPAKVRAVAGEKGATRLLKKDLGTRGKGKPSPAKAPPTPQPGSR
jgi:hypothetical protein